MNSMNQLAELKVLFNLCTLVLVAISAVVRRVRWYNCTINWVSNLLILASTVSGWLLQLVELLYLLIKQPLGHVIRDQPSLFSAVFSDKTA